MSRTSAAFPAHLWCQEITQVERQLLLLLQSNVKPNIYAYAHIYGPHDYNVEPFVPIGIELLGHNKQKRRGVFVEHCSKGYVLGTYF